MTETFIAHGFRYKLRLFVGEDAIDKGEPLQPVIDLVKRMVAGFENVPVKGVVEVHGVVVKISYDGSR